MHRARVGLRDRFEGHLTGDQLTVTGWLKNGERVKNSVVVQSTRSADDECPQDEGVWKDAHEGFPEGMDTSKAYSSGAGK
ncbi:aminoacylase [Anopheles sinensis]|uniref:Aminoacylase n=1 Tax=Anopheles sinensis TaxID=74873 RepID=A0A084VWR3_ANOSI|nr:aminoacylase [Anopheles sinensis]